MDKFQPGDYVHTKLGIRNSPTGLTYFASMAINPGAPLEVIIRMADINGEEVYVLSNGFGYYSRWLILTPISAPAAPTPAGPLSKPIPITPPTWTGKTISAPSVAPTPAPTPKFKVGDLVYTIRSDLGLMAISKTCPLPVASTIGTDLIINGFAYLPEWLALADSTEKPKAQPADFLCLQVFADEDYNPDDVMKAVRDMCGG